MWWEVDCLDRIGLRYIDCPESQPAHYHAALDSQGWHLALEEETGLEDPPEDCMLGAPDVRTFWHDDMCTMDDDELDED